MDDSVDFSCKIINNMVALPIWGFDRKYSSSAVIRRSEQSARVPVKEKNKQTKINKPGTHKRAFNDLVYSPQMQVKPDPLHGHVSISLTC
jgi:hypothetical protein